MNREKHGEITELGGALSSQNLAEQAGYNGLPFFSQPEQSKKAGKRVGRNGGRGGDKEVVLREGPCRVGISLEEAGA